MMPYLVDHGFRIVFAIFHALQKLQQTKNTVREGGTRSMVAERSNGEKGRLGLSKRDEKGGRYPYSASFA